MNKLVLMLALTVLGCASQNEAEARPRPRYVRTVQKGKPGTHRPNYTPYRGAGNPFKGMLAWMR